MPTTSKRKTGNFNENPQKTPIKQTVNKKYAKEIELGTNITHNYTIRLLERQKPKQTTQPLQLNTFLCCRINSVCRRPIQVEKCSVIPVPN